MANQPTPREKPTFSPRNASDDERTLPRIVKIKNSRGTKVFFGSILYPLSNLLSFLFPLTISRPPGGKSKQKNCFTLYTARQQPRTGNSRKPNASDALAEPQPPHEPERELDPPTGDAVFYPRSSESLPGTFASSQE